MKKKEAANAAYKKNELKNLYSLLEKERDDQEDCSRTLQKIIDYSYEHSISEEELRRRLA